MKIPAKRPWCTILLAGSLSLCFAPVADAETLTRSLSHFTIGGATPEEIERQLTSLGPEIKGSDMRHPGATRLQFTSSVTYERTRKSCRISSAKVKIAAEVILPRWRKPADAQQSARLFWEVVSADISRHEESHLVIARKHARDLEKRLVALRPAADCEKMAKTAQSTQDKVLARHDAEQQQFDRIEARSIDRRLLRKLKRRLEAAPAD